MGSEMEANMEAALENLTRLKRADGIDYFCFSEAKIKLFPNTASGTVKTWIRSLDISKEKCTVEEHHFFRTQIPEIAVGAFKMISQPNLLKLLSHVRARTEPELTASSRSGLSNSTNLCRENMYSVTQFRPFGQTGVRSTFTGINYDRESEQMVKAQSYGNRLGNTLTTPPAGLPACSSTIVYNSGLTTPRYFDNVDNPKHLSAAVNPFPLANLVRLNATAADQSLSSCISPIDYVNKDCVVSAVSQAVSIPNSVLSAQTTAGSLINTTGMTPDKPLFFTGHSKEKEHVFEGCQSWSEFPIAPKILTSESAKSGKGCSEMARDLKQNEPSCKVPRLGDHEKQANPSPAKTVPDRNDPDLENTSISQEGSKDFKFKERNSRVLPRSELTEAAFKELNEFESFYSKPLNMQRHGGQHQESTLSKTVERICSFYKFLKEVKGIQPSLKCLEDHKIVGDFCSYLLDSGRAIKKVTVSRYISSFLCGVRFLNREKSQKVQEELSSVCCLRNIRNQLEFQSRSEKCLTENKKGAKKIMFEEILQVTRDLLFEFEQSSNSVAKARMLMELCFLLLYTTVIPGRCKEFVSLQITFTEPDVTGIGQGNYLVLGEDTLILVCSSYKTQKFYGIDKTEINEENLVYHLRLYVNKFRSKLLQGNKHEYFFVNTHGLPFTGSGFRNYLNTFFEKHCNGKKLSFNELRHSIVSYFLSLPESNDNQLAEGMAVLMRHSVRSQKRFYDSRTNDEKKQPALNFLKRKSVGAIFDESDNGSTSKSDLVEDEDGFSDSLPCVGDFVALVAKNSTAKQPEVFVSKVLRFNNDKTNALLAHMDEVQMNHFKILVNKSYWDSTSSLIFPIDLAYLPSDGVYQLRSSKFEIHTSVMASKRC